MAVLVVAWLLLPGIVRSKLVEQAAARGVDLEIGAIDLGTSTIVLHDVTVSVRALPEVHLTSATVRVEHHWLDPSGVYLEGASMDVTGDPSVVQQHAAATDATAPQLPMPYVSIAGKLSWKGLAGDGTSAKCDDGTIGLNAAQVRGDATIACKAFRVTAGSLTFGPWSVSGGHSGDRGDFLNVELTGDPAHRSYAEGSRTPAGKVSWDFTISHATSTALGIPSGALSLVSLDGPPTLDATISWESTDKRATGRIDLASDAVPIGRGHAMPMHVSASFDGDPSGVLQLTGGTATVDKFSGALTGTLTPSKRRADLAFDSAVISCRDATAALATQTFGQMGQQFGGLLHAIGADQGVQGTMTLHADVTLDLANPKATKVTTKTGGDCALDLFP